MTRSIASPRTRERRPRRGIAPPASEPTGAAGVLRIAMWSGPRGLSTALMRAWGSRADTVVCDEPFYAHYLSRTGVSHPGRAEVLARHETDWRRVARCLTEESPGGKPVFYQKHMAHHLLPGMTGAWLTRLEHAFLIRSPRDVLASLAEVLPDPALEETGLPQQRLLFERVRAETGRIPPVIDAADLLADPRGVLSRLCAALGVPFDEAMLTWEPGPRATDGAWGPYWYGSVWRSTGFRPAASDRKPLPARLEPLHARCAGLYDALYEHRIR